MDRHLTFFELQKACAQPGCPLCRIVADRSRRWLDNMLFEHVSDRGFRAAHRAAGGFCAAHSRELASFRDGLAVAILGRDLLEDRLAAFRKGRPPAARAACPVCVERERIEAEYLGFLAESGGDSPEEAQLRELFAASAGLCAPHFGQLLATVRRPPRWLREFHEQKFDDLLRRTSVFIELSAYGRREEFEALSAADQLVWKELALSLRGQADLAP